MKRPETDPFSREGSARLARKIERYWRGKGHTVNVWTEEFGSSIGDEPLYGVRSDLVNGFPQSLSPSLDELGALSVD